MATLNSELIRLKGWGKMPRLQVFFFWRGGLRACRERRDLVVLKLPNLFFALTKTSLPSRIPNPCQSHQMDTIVSKERMLL